MSENPTIEQQVSTFAKFLAICPPGRRTLVTDLVKLKEEQGARGRTVIYPALNDPEIYMDCASDQCDGFRNFKCINGSRDRLFPDRNYDRFLAYECMNCHRSFKTFAIKFKGPEEGNTAGEALKYGEDPPFGPRTPARVITLIGPDRELFLKGRRAEIQGIGIGAFAYYRRVVENQKNRVLDEIINVATRTGAAPELIEQLQTAKSETQFSRAVTSVKAALPDALLLRGQNPLTLLHSALSEGIHAKSDDECLEIAKSIREVLFALVDKVEAVLAEKKELDAAVSRLTRRPKS